MFGNSDTHFKNYEQVMRTKYFVGDIIELLISHGNYFTGEKDRYGNSSIWKQGERFYVERIFADYIEVKTEKSLTVDKKHCFKCENVMLFHRPLRNHIKNLLSL